MGGKERYLFFGIGLLIGSLILAMTYIGKYNALKKQKEMDSQSGYKMAEGIVAGQDINARKPYDTGPALFTKDSEIGEDGTFTRIIIAPGSGKNAPIYRIEEILWKDPSGNREKLVRRRIMHADRIVVRLKENNNDVEQLQKALDGFNMEVLGAGNGPRLYWVKLPSYEIDAVPNAIESLTSKVDSIDAPLPSYIGSL